MALTALTTEQIDAEIARLKEERKKALAREKETEAAGEAVARDKIGALVLCFFPEGWRSVNLVGFAESLSQNPNVIAKRKPTPLAEAMKEWKSVNPKKVYKDVTANDTASHGKA